MLKILMGITITQSIKFSFILTNNQSKYEALLIGLRFAQRLGTQNVITHSNSQLMENHINGY